MYVTVYVTVYVDCDCVCDCVCDVYYFTGLQQLESRSRSGSNVSIISTRSTILERSFKAPFEPSVSSSLLLCTT